MLKHADRLKILLFIGIINIVERESCLVLYFMAGITQVYILLSPFVWEGHETIG